MNKARDKRTSKLSTEHESLTKLLTPGARFDTRYESGCRVITAPNDIGSFIAVDSDGVMCEFGVVMVTAVIEQI